MLKNNKFSFIILVFLSWRRFISLYIIWNYLCKKEREWKTEWWMLSLWYSFSLTLFQCYFVDHAEQKLTNISFIRHPFSVKVWATTNFSNTRLVYYKWNLIGDLSTGYTLKPNWIIHITEMSNCITKNV